MKSILVVLFTFTAHLASAETNLNSSIGLLKAIGSCQDGFAKLMEKEWANIESVSESSQKNKTMKIDGKKRNVKVVAYTLVTKVPSSYDFLSGTTYEGKKVAKLVIEKISYEPDAEITAGCDSSSCYEDVVNYSCKIRNY